MTSLTAFIQKAISDTNFSCWKQGCRRAMSINEIVVVKMDQGRIYYKCARCNHSGFRNINSVMKVDTKQISIEEEDFSLPFKVYDGNTILNRHFDGKCDICNADIEKIHSVKIVVGSNRNEKEGYACNRCVSSGRTFTCISCRRIRPNSEQFEVGKCSSCVKICVRCHRNIATKLIPIQRKINSRVEKDKDLYACNSCISIINNARERIKRISRLGAPKVVDGA